MLHLLLENFLYEDTLLNRSLQCQQTTCRLSNSMEDLLLEWPSKDECSNAEAALKEKLESMKRSRSGLLSFVTKLQIELNCLLKDTALYNDALKKNQAFDEALLKCIEHSAAYIQAIPRNKPDHHEVKLEAETKHVDLEMKKSEYDQIFATYAQRCTDVQGSASQISGNSSGASRKSTASSRARRLERINIDRLKAEMEAQLQFEKREMEMRIKLADLAAREAFLEMEETKSLLEKKCESKPFVVSHKIVATRSAQPIAAQKPPVSTKTMVVNTSNWESRVSFSLPQYPTASTVQSVPGPSWQSDVEPRMTQPCNPRMTQPCKFQSFLRPRIRNH